MICYREVCSIWVDPGRSKLTGSEHCLLYLGLNIHVFATDGNFMKQKQFVNYFGVFFNNFVLCRLPMFKGDFFISLCHFGVCLPLCLCVCFFLIFLFFCFYVCLFFIQFYLFIAVLWTVCPCLYTVLHIPLYLQGSTSSHRQNVSYSKLLEHIEGVGLWLWTLDNGQLTCQIADPAFSESRIRIQF